MKLHILIGNWYLKSGHIMVGVNVAKLCRAVSRVGEAGEAGEAGSLVSNALSFCTLSHAKVFRFAIYYYYYNLAKHKRKNVRVIFIDCNALNAWTL